MPAECDSVKGEIPEGAMPSQPVSCHFVPISGNPGWVQVIHTSNVKINPHPDLSDRMSRLEQERIDGEMLRLADETTINQLKRLVSDLATALDEAAMVVPVDHDGVYERSMEALAKVPFDIKTIFQTRGDEGI